MSHIYRDSAIPVNSAGAAGETGNKARKTVVSSCTQVKTGACLVLQKNLFKDIICHQII